MNEAGTNRATPENCPQCGATLPAGALAGLCPACLLQQGVAADTATHPEAKPFVPPTPEELARLFPQLEILGLLGKGGMGAVYKARQKQLDRIVALKLLPPGIGSDPAFAERFAREARALARLNHPGIVTLYEFGQVESQPSTLNPQPCLCYFLMEFVDGVNLRQLLAGGRISSREALAIVPQICDALQYAHDQGIVHRDIKPENVLLDRRGRVKVADFGLAKLVEANPPLTPVLSRSDGGKVADKPGEATTPVLTEAGKIMGTPQYMAPEQVENPSEVDRRADIYALGVVFYQMLTGELPGQPIVPPSRACGTVQIDARLDEIVLRALERKPELRYQQASILKTQVETIASTPPTGTPAAALPRMYRGVDYRSKATLFGLPLLHVADGIDPATGKRRVAKGIIAIGGMAKGVLAIGGVAMGGIAFGGLTVGVFTFGGLALGLLATGGLGVGLIAALGGLAIAPIALGGGAVGYYAFGGAAFGVHPWSSLGRDPAAEAFFGDWASGFMQRANVLMMMLVGVVVMVAAIVPAWLQSRMSQASPPPDGAKPPAAPCWRRYALGSLVGLLLLAAIVGGAMLLANVLGIVRHSVRPDSSATAEFHYRVFEAEAALVDRLIPADTRGPGVMPSVKPLTDFGQPVSERQVGDFKMTVKVGLTESQAAEIGAGTLRALLDGMAAKPGLLKEQRRTIGSWPLVADSWSSSLADTNFFGSSGGTGFLGARRKNGILQARMEGSVSHGLDALHAQPPLGVYSRILYEGNAPTNGALVFLVPFLRHNDTPRYFVWLFEIRDQTAPPRAGTTSGTNHLPLEQIGAPTAFGPVIERVLPDPDNRAGKGNNETLRLRTGQLSSVLDDAPKEGGGRSRALVASEGDLYAEYDDYVGRRWALITHGLKLSDLTPSQWENASASELNAALNIPTAVEQVEVTGATLYVLPDGLLPITFAFETRDGARGILQVTAFTDNPRGVKLRYKLAQNAPRSAELKPIPPKALELAAEWRAFLASVHTMTNISEQAARDQAANAWEVRIGEQLKGTVAEPVWQQLNAQIAEWKEAIQAQDAARAWAASRQVEALGAELARMLGLPETASGPTPSPAAGFQFRWVAREGDTNSPADLLSCRQGRGPEQKLRVLREVVLSGDDVESAGFTQLGADQKELALVLTLEASGKFAEATARNVGRQLAIVWNGRVISAPIVQAAITSRNANIAGAFTDAEARQLLDLLNHRAASTVSFSGTPGPGLPSGTASQLGAGFQIRLVALEGSTEPADDLADPTDPAGRRRIRVLRQVLLDSSAIARAGYELPYGWKSEGGTILVTTGRSQPTPERCIELDLTLAGGRAWEEITATNLNRQLAIIFRGQVLSAPVIRQRLPGTHLTIRTPLSADLVRDVVAALNAVPGSPPPAWEFSEPTEATLRWQPRAYSAIDLESGRCLTNTSPDLPPPGSIYGLPPALHEWMLTNGLDLTLLSGSRSSFTLGSCGTATWPVTVGGGSPVTLLTTPTNGHPITAADVVYNWRLMTRDEQSSRVIFGTISSKQLDGYLFRTRKGCLGVLEVLQAPTNTPGVRILYKRVQSARHQAEILAKLQALKIEETGESARWARISDELAKMSKTQLREILPRVIGRDELLETLLSALKSAQGRLSAFDATNTPGSARGATELEDLVKQVAEVERRTDERIAGILQGLKVRKDSINAGLKGLEEAMEDAQRPKPTSVK